MFKNTFFVTAVLLFTFGATLSAQDAVLSSNAIYEHGPTSFVTGIGTVSPNNGITNSSSGQRFNSGSGGLISGLETIIGRRSLSHPLTISIHESDADLPSTVLGSITVAATSVPEYDFADTPLTRFDFTSLGLVLAPDTEYFVSFNSAPSSSGSGNFTLRVIDPTFRHGQDYVFSRNAGLSWELPPVVFETGELPLTVFGTPSGGIPLQILTLTPSVDAEAELIEGAYEIDNDDTSLNIQKIEFADLDKRVILEFTLPVIPDNRQIVSAELELYVNSFGSSPSRPPAAAQIYGYSADNVATPEDALRTDLLVGIFGPVSELGPINRSFDAGWLNTLVEEGTTEIGLLMVGVDISSFGFDSSDPFLPHLRTDAPELKLTLQSLLLGDCNLDGVVNFLDIAAFISILTAADSLAEADVNQDDVVNFLDIAPFIAILAS